MYVYIYIYTYTYTYTNNKHILSGRPPSYAPPFPASPQDPNRIVTLHTRLLAAGVAQVSYSILYYTILYYTILYYTILYCTILYIVCSI